MKPPIKLLCFCLLGLLATLGVAQQSLKGSTKAADLDTAPPPASDLDNAPPPAADLDAASPPAADLQTAPPPADSAQATLTIDEGTRGWTLAFTSMGPQRMVVLFVGTSHVASKESCGALGVLFLDVANAFPVIAGATSSSGDLSLFLERLQKFDPSVEGAMLYLQGVSLERSATKLDDVRITNVDKLVLVSATLL